MFKMVSTRIVLSTVVVIFLVKSINCSEDKQDSVKEVEVTKSDLSANNPKDINDSKDDGKNTVHVIKTEDDKEKEMDKNETPAQGESKPNLVDRLLSLSVRDVISCPINIMSQSLKIIKDAMPKDIFHK